MEKVIVIYCSPTMLMERGSISSLMAKEFIDEYKKTHNANIIELNLNELEMSKKTLTSDNFNSFFNEEDSLKYINQLKESTKVIIAVPMTNFNYPSVLKNYLDHILMANKTFRYKYNANGKSEGLLTHLKVQLLTTQGADFGWYPWGNVAAMLKGTWEFMGAKVADSINIYGTKTPSKIKMSAVEVIQDYIKEIQEAANKF